MQKAGQGQQQQQRSVSKTWHRRKKAQGLPISMDLSYFHWAVSSQLILFMMCNLGLSTSQRGILTMLRLGFGRELSLSCKLIRISRVNENSRGPAIGVLLARHIYLQRALMPPRQEHELECGCSLKCGAQRRHWDQRALTGKEAGAREAIMPLQGQTLGKQHGFTLHKRNVLWGSDAREFKVSYKLLLTCV